MGGGYVWLGFVALIVMLGLRSVFKCSRLPTSKWFICFVQPIFDKSLHCIHVMLLSTQCTSLLFVVVMGIF